MFVDTSFWKDLFLIYDEQEGKGWFVSDLEIYK